MADMNFEVRIAAPAQHVWSLISDIDNWSKTVPGITKIEKLTDKPFGPGLRFRETRTSFGRDATETMEITACDPPRSYVLEALSCGVQYSTKVAVASNGAGSVLSYSMRCIPKSVFAKIVGPIMRVVMGGMMKKCLEGDLNAIKTAAEKPA